MTKTYGRLWLEDGRWKLDAEPQVLIRFKRLFTRVKGQHGTMELSDTAENCRDLLWFTGRYPVAIAPRDLSKLRAGEDEHRDRIQRLEDLIDPAYEPPGFDLALPPRDYQRRAAAVLHERGGLCLGDELGLGKSCSAICGMGREDALPALVVAYPHLQRQWAAEVRKFAPDLHVHVIKAGTPYELPETECVACRDAKRRAKRGRRRGQAADDVEAECSDPSCGRGPDVIVTTYAKLAGWAEVLAKYVKYATFDECQELRHSDSKKYAAAKHIADQCDYRIGLSATPIFNYGGEMFNVLEVLAPGELGTREEFTREWCDGSDKKLKVKDPDAFGAYLRENFLMLRRTRAEVGRELPPVVRVPQQVECDTAALDRIEDRAAELARILLSRTEAKKGDRLQAAEELSNVVRQATGIAKAPYVAEFVRLLVDSGEKVLLVGWHRAVYDVWAAKLKGLRVGWYTGSESPAAKEASKAAFLAGETDVMFLSLRSGAGLNELQTVCRVIVFGELDWAPAVHEQAIGRLHRDGLMDGVTAYFMLSDAGSDPVMSETLGLKRAQLDGIRAPGKGIMEKLETDGQHVKRLAQQYLNKRGGTAAPEGAAA